MKNSVLRSLIFFVALTTFTSCKHEKSAMPVHQPECSLPPENHVFDDYPQDPVAQVTWLRDNEISRHLCDESLDSYRICLHRISNPDDFNDAVAAYADGKAPAYLTYKLETLVALADKDRKYKYYICVKPNMTGKLTLYTVQNYTTDAACYSIPLFISLLRQSNLYDDHLVHFAMAKIGTKSTAVFKMTVSDGQGATQEQYMNYSHDPKTASSPDMTVDPR